MLTRDTQQGTTPEVLQHYLTAGITILATTSDGDNWPCRLLALDAFNGKVTYTPIFEDGGDGGLWQAAASKVTPVLRPFSQLREPLPGGTVPAVAIASIVGTPYPWKVVQVSEDTILLLEADSGGQFIIRNITSPSIGWHFDYYTSGRIKQDPRDLLAAYDYLRRQHFALPVNGRPLVEGIDFIPKAGGAPSIEREVAGS